MLSSLVVFIEKILRGIILDYGWLGNDIP